MIDLRKINEGQLKLILDYFNPTFSNFNVLKYYRACTGPVTQKYACHFAAYTDSDWCVEC